MREPLTQSILRYNYLPKLNFAQNHSVQKLLVQSPIAQRAGTTFRCLGTATTPRAPYTFTPFVHCGAAQQTFPAPLYNFASGSRMYGGTKPRRFWKGKVGLGIPAGKKLKTHSGLKKRVRAKPSGKVFRMPAGKQKFLPPCPRTAHANCEAPQESSTSTSEPRGSSPSPFARASRSQSSSGRPPR